MKAIVYFKSLWTEADVTLMSTVDQEPPRAWQVGITQLEELCPPGGQPACSALPHAAPPTWQRFIPNT